MNIILKIFSIYFRVLFRKRLQRANIHVYTQTVFHRNQSPVNKHVEKYRRKHKENITQKKYIWHICYFALFSTIKIFKNERRK